MIGSGVAEKQYFLTSFSVTRAAGRCSTGMGVIIVLDEALDRTLRDVRNRNTVSFQKE